jgi:hypothetical protein
MNDFYCRECKVEEPVCDDYCLECEIAFFRTNPDEQPDLLEQVERDPVRFAAWVPVVKALREAA